ncbi:MAG: galactitol-1-phosphate 5-dehydrogenase [Rhodopirellula sp.]|nr:galactitol-1-phosphate 5-dehydrogenase [Rhodopirellula sp.]
MKALVLTRYNQLDYLDVPEPQLGEGDVLVEVKACGICGSDVHGLDGSSGRRIPPIIMGHEAAGVVARVGDRVSGYAVGDRVTFDSTVSCGNCHYCRQGRINLCDRRRVLGVSCREFRCDGAYAERVAVPQRILYRLPDNLSFERAALVEPVSVAVHAVGRMPVRLNDTAVVIGTGMIGLLVVQALRLCGCGKIFAVDLDDRKLELACRLGAAEGLSPAETGVAETIRRWTAGRGADLVLEVVGLPATVELALDCCRKGGSIGLIGNLSPQVPLPLQAAVTRELTLFGSCASAGEYPACLEMIAGGAINVDAVTSAIAPLAEGAAWFERLGRGGDPLMKVILQPRPSDVV